MVNTNKPLVWIIIPAYNEEKSIGRVIEDVKFVTDSIVVVDDASRDRTADIARRTNAIVLSHCLNRGQGAALQTGTDYAIRNGADIIIHFDADGQHQGNDISRFIGPIMRDEADVILGSRFLSKSASIPFIRRCILKLGILFTWMYSGIKLTDTHNGFRAFSRSAAKRIHITENGMAHASEILHEIARQHLRYKEVSVSILYTNYSLSKGQSSMNAFRIVTRLIWKTLF